MAQPTSQGRSKLGTAGQADYLPDQPARSWTGPYVSVSGGGGGGINVVGRGIGTWETLYLIDANGGDFNYGDPCYIRTLRGNVFCAEGGGGREVNATRDDPHEWERFTIYYGVAGPAIRVQYGDTVSLRSWNGNFLCADYNYPGTPLMANRSGVGDWERFRITIERASDGEAAAEFALTKIRHPYSQRADLRLGPNYFDCSGLTYWSYMQDGKSIPTNSDTQRSDAYTYLVNDSDAQRGDLVFFPGHVGIYLGDNWFVNASAENWNVRINSLTDPQYRRGSPLYPYQYARRVR